MKTFNDYGIDINGKTGQIKVLCPKCSSTRKKRKYPCLSVNTDLGTWICFHCDWQGGLKTGQENISNPYAWKPKTYIKPTIPTERVMGKVEEYFTKRGISKAVLDRNKITSGEIYMPQLEKEVNTIMFPYYRNGELINIKYRDNQKNFRMGAGAERIFYGFDDIETDSLIIVEGEMDKLSLEEAGFISVVSVPDGAPPPKANNYGSKFSFIESSADIINNCKEIILAVDNDLPGETLQEELSRRIGKEKCKVVAWPEGCKDANDVLVKLGETFLVDIINNAKPYPIKGIFTVDDILEQIKTLRQEGFTKGINPGWDSVAEKYRVSPGVWTVVTGIPSHGKSEFIDALIINMANIHDWHIGIYSPENQPLERHAKKLMEKYIGKYFWSMKDNEIELGMGFLNHYFSFLLPQDEDPHSVKAILSLAKVLVLRKGIKGLVIDPWNELDHSRPYGVTETEYISQSLSKIRKFARDYGVHIWLVSHPTKLQKCADGTYPVPTPYDISGSAHWRNKADNAISVWRDLNSKTEPVQIHIQKIRFKEDGEIGRVDLYYDTVSGRYR